MIAIKTNRSRKKCPKCSKRVSCQVSVCACGYCFDIQRDIQSYFPMVKGMVGRFLCNHHIFEAVEDSEEYAEAIMAVLRVAEKHNGRTTALSTGAHIAAKRAMERQFTKRKFVKTVEDLDVLPSRMTDYSIREFLVVQPTDSRLLRRDKQLLIRWLDSGARPIRNKTILMKVRRAIERLRRECNEIS